MAFTVGTAFSQFCGALRFSEDDLSSIHGRYHLIARIIFDYLDPTSDMTHGLFAGSFSRGDLYGQ